MVLATLAGLVSGLVALLLKTLVREWRHKHAVLEKFDITQSWYLPVLGKENKFIRFISKTKLFNKYR